MESKAILTYFKNINGRASAVRAMLNYFKIDWEEKEP